MQTKPSSGVRQTPNGKAVLITGCSSGIGRATALRLARGGFTVFATVRKPADADDLRRLQEPNLVPVCPLDLTHPDEIAAAHEWVTGELSRRGLPGLHGLVNNAGGGSVAPIELMDLEKYHVELQARLLGPVALLQAFLPAMRAAHGRLVWIVTPALIPTPFVASIHAADFAANCLARTLNLELRPWQIPSIMVRCGGIQTGSPAKSAAELAQAMVDWPAERVQPYAASLEAAQKSFAEFDTKRTPAEAVAQVVFRALSAPKPRLRYQVGYMSGLAAFLESLPQPLADRLIALRG
jgi:NAD(P)-dependent dehydrogenase (short-subunit alcohol dehydrogenase family)